MLTWVYMVLIFWMVLSLGLAELHGNLANCYSQQIISNLVEYNLGYSCSETISYQILHLPVIKQIDNFNGLQVFIAIVSMVLLPVLINIVAFGVFKLDKKCSKCNQGHDGEFKIWEVLGWTCVEVGANENICEKCCSACPLGKENRCGTKKSLRR